MADTNVSCGPIDLVVSTELRMIFTSGSVIGRDYTLDQFIDDCKIDLTLSMLGELLNISIPACTIVLTLSQEGSANEGEIVACGPIVVTLSPEMTYVTPEFIKSNWVKWSKIGSLSFTIDQGGEAGERPLDWKGFVYQLLKLGSSVIAYGANGVSALSPSGINWGLQNIYKVGLASRVAVAGTETEHYFVDKKGKLWSLSNSGLKLLDYSEYLADLVDPKLSLDVSNGLLYICDGVDGFVYSTRDGSFGYGPENVTGIGMQDGEVYVVSPSTVVVPTFQITTDIYDLGTRKPKTIQSLEIGTDLTQYLEAMIESRNLNNESFRPSPWILVNPSGIANVPCYGVEFKFHLRSHIYEYLELDYLRVNGVVHGVESYFLESQI